MQKNNLDIVGQAIALFQQLQKRRGELQAEIDRIDQALGQFSSGSSSPQGKQPPRGLPANPLNLRQALTQVLQSGPKTKQEILNGVKQLGYVFSSQNPMNSLNAFLYVNKKMVQKVDGNRVALVGGAAALSSTAKPKTAAPARKAKRQISAEGRKRIAEAARKMWAERKKAAAKK